LEHIAGNVCIQLFLGVGIENGIGFLKMSFLYLLTGFGGNLLSACIAPEQFGVGASTSVFGLVGFLAAYSFTNFFYMGRKTPG
jgi:membrane associated rhomboid family serine protease